MNSIRLNSPMKMARTQCHIWVICIHFGQFSIDFSFEIDRMNLPLNPVYVRPHHRTDAGQYDLSGS